jgi:hypothetical protein
MNSYNASVHPLASALASPQGGGHGAAAYLEVEAMDHVKKHHLQRCWDNGGAEKQQDPER